MDYYTYIYLDTRKPGNFQYGDYKFNFEPFYVGKGSGTREHSHLKKVKTGNYGNLKRYHIINNILTENKSPMILKLEEHLEEAAAFNSEIYFIKLIGREVHGGPLVNLTDGGEGQSGYKHTDATKRILSEMTKLQFKENGHTTAGRPLSKSHKDKLRYANLGKKQSKQTKLKRSDSLKDFYKNNEYPEHVKEIVRKSQLGENNSLFKSRCRWYLVHHPNGLIDEIYGVKRTIDEQFGFPPSTVNRLLRTKKPISSGPHKGFFVTIKP